MPSPGMPVLPYFFSGPPPNTVFFSTAYRHNASIKYECQLNKEASQRSVDPPKLTNPLVIIMLSPVLKKKHMPDEITLLQYSLPMPVK
jgi:hypothetical protein